jgi:predicted enzyme related to lactoylglutathione lyase
MSISSIRRLVSALLRVATDAMNPAVVRPVVHLELHTPDPDHAQAFYAGLCGWSPHRVETPAGAYQALDVGGGIGGGIVRCPTERALWLPYVEVSEIEETTARARELGARLLLSPREGPAGWRSVIAAPAGGELALWQPKR